MDLRTEKLNRLKDHFGGECSGCGEKRYWVLEFHHTNPREKSGRPGWREVRGWSFERILEEYERETELLCRNCHGDEHYQMRIDMDYQDD
jgi:5-methylcytosine-specific restriction endonuclease McrA